MQTHEHLWYCDSNTLVCVSPINTMDKQIYGESYRRFQGSVLLVDVCANCSATAEIRWDCLDWAMVNNDEKAGTVIALHSILPVGVSAGIW